MTADRTPKPCHCPKARHQHGTRMAYIRDRCRCLPCCAANADYAARQNRQRAYGRTVSGWVDAEPVRQHVRAILATGVGWKRVGRVAGVASGTMTTLLYGKKREDGRRSGPCRRMNPEAARRLLAVPLPTVAQLPGAVPVDGTGVRRRLQALGALGWSIGAVAREAGIDRQSLDGAMHGKPVLARTHQAIATAYEELWERPPAAARPAELGAITRTVNAAKRAGWALPLAWDDDTIDDPTAEPHLGDVDEDLVDELAVEHVLEGVRLRLTGATLHAAVHALAAAGHQPTTIAERLGLDERQVYRLRDRTEPPRPWRRREAA